MAQASIGAAGWRENLSGLCTQVGCHPIWDEPLSMHTSFGVGGPADGFVEPATVEQLAALGEFCGAYSVPLFILGNGTNVIVNDRGFRGVVVTLKRLEHEANATTDGEFIRAGRPLAALVSSTVKKGLSGLEPLTDIPGTVGGAVFLNAGAFGRSVWDCLERVWLMFGDGGIEAFQSSDFQSSYRDSGIIPGEIVLGATFRLQECDPNEAAEAVRGYSQRRAESQPLSHKSAGCVFKNPAGLSAGELIEKAGLKGRSVGSARISNKHGNFILNEGRGLAADILSLIRLVRDEVKRSTGVVLTTEVQVLGEYGLMEV
ncbi:MAG TPA: UDP-N-acetylmuramate dehydrogenase [bacterium]|nr:UDP-N-acetylmuramate dehydrogenase [bacterium]